MHKKDIFIDKPMITSSHLQPTIKYIIYPWNQTVGYCMPETTILSVLP